MQVYRSHQGPRAGYPELQINQATVAKKWPHAQSCQCHKEAPEVLGWESNGSFTSLVKRHLTLVERQK